MPPDPHDDIVPENIKALGAIYFAFMLEELRLFQVVDRVVELFSQGLLPIGQGAAGDSLHQLWRRADRLTPAQRASLYALALGVPGGDTGGAEPNSAFISLWLRFLVAVGAHSQQHGSSGLLPPHSASNAGVRSAARALAGNASAHGGGLVPPGAVQLTNETREAVDLLNDPEMRQAFGARDAWQVMDQVNRTHLGGARDVIRHRTQATAGSRILYWLAEHADQLRDDAPPVAGASAADASLVHAVEEWLAVSGAADAMPPAGEERATESPHLGRAADDLLEAVGVPATDAAERTERMRERVTLFQGGPRSGKTLGAYVLADALEMDVLRVDLSQVMSKYIGETEKNLRKLFEAAEHQRAILLLDEADALFGKRTDVKDAHDRFANVEVAHVMRRLAEYDGAVILTTRNEVNLDEPPFSDEWPRRETRVVRFPRKPR